MIKVTTMRRRSNSPRPIFTRSRTVRDNVLPSHSVIDPVIWDACLTLTRQSVVVAQLPWPERFGVTFTAAGSGHTATYTVVTWLHERKAVFLALEEYRRRWPDERVFDVDVDVQSLGPAPRDERGLVSVNGDLHDRFEF